MHLPINISNLLHGTVVESDRLELKADYNPESVLRTICAFANDFNNFGGGYIVIGIEEKEGKPVLPPQGIELSKADAIQKDLIRICSFLKPVYTPIVAVETYQKKHVLVIWVPGGQTRPYSAPMTLGKNKEYKYFIRKSSSTVMAKHEELKELIGLTATVPFDDRINHHATIEELRLPLIQAFLKEIDSKLLEESRQISFADLCRQMAIVDGGNEYLKPRNIGLLFFNDQPDKFFPYAQIDVVYFPQGEGGDQIQEEIFKGPLDHQLRGALRYIRNNFITEKIIKLPDRAEARRFFNYPYLAIEEALVNAVYHRSYEIREPIEVRINLDKIEILNFPGPDPSISAEALKRERMVTRRYRNRRIGELLKELKFTEGRSTGMPKIYRALAANGSPPPRIETNEDRTYFLIEFPIHPEMRVLEAEAQVKAYDQAQVEAYDEAQVKLSETELKILHLCQKQATGNKEIIATLGYKSLGGHLKKALKHLQEMGAIAYTIPEKPRSRNQQYKITAKGTNFLTSK